MALEKKIIGLPIAKGVNDKISDRVLPLGELTIAKNVQFIKGGEAKKREGFNGLRGIISTSSGNYGGQNMGTASRVESISSYNDEVLAFDGRFGYSRTSVPLYASSEFGNSDSWVNKGTIVGCTLESAPVSADSNMIQTAAQIAQSGALEVHVWSEMDPSEAVSRSVANTGSADVGSEIVEMTGATDHNFSVGSKVTVTFAHVDWADGDYIVTAVPATSTYRIDYDDTVPAAATAATSVIVGAQTWRTYAKVLDKANRGEVVGKTLVNTFTTGNSVHNVPRAQVVTVGSFIYIFVHVGSGRVKHTIVDTTDRLSEDLIPGLLADGSGETFLVDQTYPHWHVAATNYIEEADADGFVLFRRLDGGGSQTLRLSTWKPNPSGGALSGGSYGEQSTPGPRVLTDAVYFHDPNLLSMTHTTEGYSTNPGHIEVAGGLMLSVVKSDDDTEDKYVAIGYTKSIDGTSAGGTADEPGGVYLGLYNSRLDRVNSGSELATVGGVTTAFTAVSAPGYVLVNGCAGISKINVIRGVARFFVTMVKNVRGLYWRSQPHLVNAYDSRLSSTPDLLDKAINLHNCTVTSDTFFYNNDFYLALGYATRHNSVVDTGSLDVNAFDNAVELLVNQNGEVVAKGANGAGPISQDINFRCLTNYTVNDAGTSVVRRFNLMHSLPKVVTESATLFRYGASRYSGVAINDDGSDIPAIDAGLSVIDMHPTRFLPNVQANGSLMLAGGILWNYSGDYFKEENFFYWPEVHSFTETALSNAVDVGAHSWVAIYEWIGADGKIQRSKPSYPITHTIASAAKKITLNVFTLQLSYKQDLTGLIIYPGGDSTDPSPHWGTRSESKIVVYRTVAEGSIYHRCAEVLMDRTAGYQAIEDTLPDSELEDNPVLYTTGGIAPHICPPSQYDIALWKDRVFLATTENTVWFSKTFANNREAGFSDFFIRAVDNRAEKIRALCPNLEHLLIFGVRNGYYMSGDGPTATGSGPGFSPLRVFAPGQGAIDGTCRAETPVGVFFQTSQGLMLCSRNMQLTYKGARVEDTITTANRAIDAHVFAKDHEVRFSVRDSTESIYVRNTFAVYNFLYDQWSTWELGPYTGNSGTLIGSTVVNDVHYMITEVGFLYKQGPIVGQPVSGTVSPTGETDVIAYYDSLNYVAWGYPIILTTGWINIGQLQQVGRVYRLLLLGDFNADSKPHVVIYTDYETSGTLVGYPTTGPGTSKFQLEVKLPKQKVKAIKFTVSETNPTPSNDETGVNQCGGYMAIQSISMLVGLKKPGTSFKLPSADHITAT